jgi:hypothetical protein
VSSASRDLSLDGSALADTADVQALATIAGFMVARQWSVLI